jgi:hypothetical protein
MSRLSSRPSAESSTKSTCPPAFHVRSENINEKNSPAWGEKPPGKWGVVRAIHCTERDGYPSSLPYVVSSDGMRRIETPVGAVDALRRHAATAGLRVPHPWPSRRAA